MKSYDAAQEILAYLNVCRQRGHTTAVLNGAKNTQCLVAVPTLDAGRLIEKQLENTPSETVSLGEIGYGQLRGHNLPLVLDNSAVITLLSDLVSQIAVLKQNNAEMETKLRNIARILGP